MEDVCCLHCAFGQDHTSDNALVLDALVLARTLEERHLQDELLGLALDSVENSLEVGVPASLEAVVPATVQRVSGLQLEVCLAVVGPEARSRNVSDVVNEVGVNRSNAEREAHFLQSGRRRVEVVCLLVGNTTEVVLELRSTVGKPVTLLGCDIAAPVADLNVPLQKCGMCDRFGVLVAYADLLLGACRKLAVRTIGESGSLLLRVFLAIRVQVRRKNGSIRNVGCGKLKLGLLLKSGVCARSVGGKLVQNILLVVLLNLRRKRLKGGENEIRDREGELFLGG